MPTCKGCDEEVEKLVSVKVDGKAKKLCEDCADRARESAESLSRIGASHARFAVSSENP